MSVLSRIVCGLVSCGALICPAVGHAQTFQTLYTFTGTGDSEVPMAGLTTSYLKDGTLVLYGTTCGNACIGNHGDSGSIFMLNPATGTLTTLYTFTGGADGASPLAGVVLRGKFLYGTTNSGGDPNCTTTGNLPGCGTLFRFDLSSGKLTTLHTFTNNGDQEGPAAPVIFDASGTLYGTTNGGLQSYGSVYKFDIQSSTFTTLYSFCSQAGCVDGGFPASGGVVLGSDGRLYGATAVGGADDGGSPFSGGGTVFALDPATETLSTLNSFTNGGGGDEGGSAGVIFKGKTLYGLSSNGGVTNGGNYGYGSLFAINPALPNFKTKFSFCVGGGDYNCPNGGHANPGGMLTLHNGALYGVTGDFGAGSVFEFNPSTKQMTTLTDFAYDNSGDAPNGGLVFDRTGALYGTTRLGPLGNCDCGTVFKITP